MDENQKYFFTQKMIKTPLTKEQKKTIKRITTGGTFTLTPILICIMLFYKNASFTVDRKNQEISKNIEAEKIRSANITLEFTKYQNHQKILDLQSQYLPNMRYINHGDITSEEQIELL